MIDHVFKNFIGLVLAIAEQNVLKLPSIILNVYFSLILLLFHVS